MTAERCVNEPTPQSILGRAINAGACLSVLSGIGLALLCLDLRQDLQAVETEFAELRAHISATGKRRQTEQQSTVASLQDRITDLQTERRGLQAAAKNGTPSATGRRIVPMATGGSLQLEKPAATAAPRRKRTRTGPAVEDVDRLVTELLHYDDADREKAGDLEDASLNEKPQPPRGKKLQRYQRDAVQDGRAQPDLWTIERQP
jgi:hypothetical protein